MSARVRMVVVGIAVGVGLAAAGSSYAAQLPDAFECYTIKDPLRLKGLIDVDSTEFGLSPGCKVSAAKLFCVPAGGTVQEAFNGKTPIITLPFAGKPVLDDTVCYKVKCPASTIADQPITDQFGARTVSKFKTSMFCVPAATGTAYCGDGTIEAGETCEATDLGGATCASLGFASGTLGCAPGCTFNTSGCVPYPAPTCGNGAIDGAESCDGADLGGATCASLGYTLGGFLGCTPGCGFDVSGCKTQGFPATGQTTPYTADRNDGIAGPVAVPDDGTLKRGASLHFTDNGDGTITDMNSGLMWEKKSQDGGEHDKENIYCWSGNGSQETMWDWVNDLNASAFAGYGDWRIPNMRELTSLLDYAQGDPALDPIFNTGCAPGCTVLTCSCAISAESGSLYVSSTTIASGADLPSPASSFAWAVRFTDGETVWVSKSGCTHSVRAVRAGT